MSDGRSSILGRGILLAVSLAIGVGLGELMLRVFVPAPPDSDLRQLHVLRPDRPWLYGMRPSTVVEGRGGIRYAINADGFRGPAAARPKRPGTVRIAVIGDSLTFGYAVSEANSYPALLAARLAAVAPNRPVEVLNLGVSGYNPYTEAALFADVGPTYAPDIVLVQFCINDLNDPTMHFDASTTAALGHLPAAAFPDPRTRNPAAERTVLDCRGFRLCQVLRDLWRPPAAKNDPVALRAALEPQNPPQETEIAWLTARYAEIGRTAAAIGARPVLVIFPYSTQLGPDVPSGVETRLVALANTLGWTAVDLLPAFRAADDQRTLFTDLWHPTATGYRIAADATADALLRGHLLDR